MAVKYEITTEHFERSTGHAPQDDDMERANCPHAGEATHTMCGWDYLRDMPKFIPGVAAYLIPHNEIINKLIDNHELSCK